MTYAIGATNTTNLRTNFLAVFAGYRYQDLWYQDTDGGYWSSTAYNATSAYGLDFNGGRIYNRGDYPFSKYWGVSVRCVSN